MVNYRDMGRTELGRLANQRELRPDGSSGSGASGWRATASKDDLIAALTAHDNATTLTIPAASHTSRDDAALKLAEMIAALTASPAVDEATVRTIVVEEVAKVRAGITPIKVELPSGSVIDVGRQHERFPLLLRLVATRVPVFIVGPAGSGKTEAARHVARALELAFFHTSFSAQTTEAKLLGYSDANGRFVDTALTLAATEGGLFLGDELDNSNPNVLASINASLSNGHIARAGRTVEKHPDCRFAFTGNTYGMGANRVYVGRQQLDAATLDRFVVLDWPYDEAFERDLALVHNPDASHWIEQVQNYRRSADAAGIRHVISPRASINGAKLLATGLNWTDVESMAIWKGLDTDSIRKIKGGA